MVNLFAELFKNKREIFKEIYEENFDAVYSFVYARMGGRTEAAMDIVQDTFISAMKSVGNFRGKSSCRTWLCGIARHKIYDYYRKEIAGSAVDYMDGIQTEDDRYNLEEIVINKDIKNTVLEVLDKLNPNYRYVLILKYIEGLSMKEIGDILERTPKAIDGILQRAKVQFKNEYFKIERTGYHEK